MFIVPEYAWEKFPGYRADALVVLKHARGLIAKKRNWTRGAFKRPRRDADTGYAYCALGAVEEAEHVLGMSNARSVLHSSVRLHSGVMSLNDNSLLFTHRRVLKTFDRAIASLEAKRATESRELITP